MVTLTDEQANIIWGFLKMIEKNPEFSDGMLYTSINKKGEQSTSSYTVDHMASFLEDDDSECTA